MKDTLAYYNNNADAFVESMFQVSMEELHLELLPQVPEDGNIPNAGSGLTEQGIKGAILPFLFIFRELAIEHRGSKCLRYNLFGVN